MNESEINQKKDNIISKYGNWTAHNIRLTDTIYTIQKTEYKDVKLRRIMQIVNDLSPIPLDKLRILDLACLEGKYAIEFALHQAKCVGIEGREANIKKAQFVKDILNLNNLELYQDDVRNLSKNKYGTFDVILCLGLLYHLDGDDLFQLLDKMYELTNYFVVLDTHIALKPDVTYTYKNRKYYASKFIEHDENLKEDDKLNNLWASLDNNESLWLSKPSLCNALAHTGFTSVFVCQNPSEIEKTNDRITIVAIKGKRETLLSNPEMSKLFDEDWPEDS